MNTFAGKKLLLLGGGYGHLFAVETAKEMGLTVYVTDYLNRENAPAKQAADHAWMYNIYDIDEIVEACKQEQIDAVLSVNIDLCQKPYQQICEKLGKPCFGTAEQFHILTDKPAFKQFCREHGVDVIPDYTEDIFCDEVSAQGVEYPVLVKPANSRGSIGQTVCHTRQEVLSAIEIARAESRTGEILIEQCMDGCDDFTMTYLVINGVPHLIRMTDRLLGPKEEGLERVAVGGVAPSKHVQTYLTHAHDGVVNMIQALGVKNGPVFLQGFVNGDKVYFYDPAFRFPGTDYERIYHAVHNVNLTRPLIEYALTGTVSAPCRELHYGVDLKGRCGMILVPQVRPGTIHKIIGIEQIRSHPNVVSFSLLHQEGDKILAYHSTRQIVAEIDLVCDDLPTLEDTVAWIYDSLRVEDETGKDMLCACPKGIAAPIRK